MISQTNVTQNTAITTNYTDNLNSVCIVKAGSASPYYIAPPSLTYGSDNTNAAITGFNISGTYIRSTLYDFDNVTGDYTRVNIYLGGSYVITQGKIALSYIYGSAARYYFYGSNSTTAYNDTSTTVNTGLTLLGSVIGSASATVSFTNTNLFQYVHIFVRTVSGTQTS